MAKLRTPSQVYCYHCSRRFEVGPRTMSTVCPGCHKPVMVQDLVVKGYLDGTNLETCGKLIVGRRGYAVAKDRIFARGGIEVKGRVHCQSAVTDGQANIFGKAEWRGDLSAASLVVEQGAVIKGGHFTVPKEIRKDSEGLD